MFHSGVVACARSQQREMGEIKTTMSKIDAKLDDLAVRHAKLTAKVVGIVAVAQALLQVALKII